MTLDEQLQRAADEVRDRFEGLEPLYPPASETRPRSRIRSGPVVAAVAFLAVLVVGATLLWLGPLGGEHPDVAGEIEPPSGLVVDTSPSLDDAVVDAPSADSCVPVVDPVGAIDSPVPAVELPRTKCALTDVLNAYFGAWAAQDPDTVTSYFQPEAIIVISGPESGSESGTYTGDDARALIERWFAEGLRTDRQRDGGGGTRTFHYEAMTYTFGTAEPTGAVNVLEFTTDPFTAARDEESPLVAHYIFMVPDPSATLLLVADHLLNGGKLDTLDTLLAVPVTTAVPTPTTADVQATAPPTTAASALIDPPLGRLRSVVVGGPGFVAVGETEDTPAVWTSPDGTEWTGAPVGTTAGVMFDAAIGGPGFVAVGASEGLPAVWASSDGLAWTQVFIGEAAGEMYSLSFGEIGVATGYLDCGPECDGVAAGWVSEDGFAWNEVDYSEAVRIRGEANGAAAVVNNVESGGMARTVDGEWMSESAVDPARAEGVAALEVVVPLEDGRFVAVGRTCAYSIAAWLSHDGVAWSWMDLQPLDDVIVQGAHDVIVWGATVGKGQLVMVGSQSGGRAFVWVIALEDLLVPTVQEPAESCH